VFAPPIYIGRSKSVRVRLCQHVAALEKALEGPAPAETDTYLDKAGAIDRTRRSHFRITDRGRELLAHGGDVIGVDDLNRFAEFRAFRSGRGSDALAAGSQAASAGYAPTPEEAIAQAEAQIIDSLRNDLMDRILEMPPAFFEQLVVDLIVAMGYGGSRSSVAKRIGRSGDEGIDGVVNQDALGLDVIYIQAKRYAVDRVIGREVVQQFIGALVGQGAHRGVLVTTSAFAKSAREYAAKVPQRVILVDGDVLTRLMLEHEVGVRTERTVHMRRIDLDYFTSATD
jgi:restriction system protein